MASVLEELVDLIMVAQTSFRRACNQIMVLNRVISGMQARYDLAMKQNARIFRYSQRVRIAVAEGVRNMFYEYARQKAEYIVELRNQIEQEEQQHDIEDEHHSHYDDDDEYHAYGDEYDMSDSELECSDFEFSDFEDENEAEVGSFHVLNTMTNTSDERAIEKVNNDKNLNGTEISMDSAFLDDSVTDDDSFSL